MQKLSKLNSIFKESLRYRFHTFETFHPLFFKLGELELTEFEDFSLLIRRKDGKKVLLDFYLKRKMDPDLMGKIVETVLAENFDFVELNGEPELCSKFTSLLVNGGFKVSRDAEVFRRFVSPEDFEPSSGQKRKMNYTERCLVDSKFQPITSSSLEHFVSRYQKFQVLKGFKLKRGPGALLALEKLADGELGRAYLQEAIFEYEGEEVTNTNLVVVWEGHAFFMYGMSEPFTFKASTFSPGLWSQVDIIKRLRAIGVGEYGLGSFNPEFNSGLAKFKTGFKGRTLELRQILLSKK